MPFLTLSKRLSQLGYEPKFGPNILIFGENAGAPGGAEIGSRGSRLWIEAASCGTSLEGVARDRTALVLCRDSSISRLGGWANISFAVIHGYNHTSSAKIEACQRSWGVVVVSKEACYNKAPQRGPHLLCSKYNIYRYYVPVPTQGCTMHAVP